MLDSTAPYYQAGLGNRLCYKLTFNDYNRVIKSPISPKVPDAKYKITDIFEEEQSYTGDTSKFYNPKIQKVSVIVEGKPNMLYTQGMRSFEQYDEICKYFTEGKQRDNNTNEIQKHLQLYDLSLGEYLVNRYALWLDFRTIDENELHGTGRHIENASEGITLKIEKKAESAGTLNAYIYLIMDAQLNIQNGAHVSAVY